MLTLYSHPLASFCQKILVALYENETPFRAEPVGNPGEGPGAELLALWPVGKFPVLHDAHRGKVLPESTIILEYLDQHYRGPVPLLPENADARLEARLWDRFYDLYVQTPMQKIVGDRLRPENERDPRGVAEAKAGLQLAYGMIDERMKSRRFGMGEAFGVVDCAAAPALFYAQFVEPFPEDRPNLAAYYERIEARPCWRRVLAEAQPFFQYFPYKEAMPARYFDPLEIA